MNFSSTYKVLSLDMFQDDMTLQCALNLGGSVLTCIPWINYSNNLVKYRKIILSVFAFSDILH